MSDKLRDTYKCTRCESKCVLTSLVDDDGNSWDENVLYGQLCSCSEWEKTSEPPHETVDQWEKRTGETYPDDGPVWIKTHVDLTLNSFRWVLSTYSGYSDWDIGKDRFYVANHHGKPPVDQED